MDSQMTDHQTQSIKRRIADKRHNRYVAEGMDSHNSTKIAPSTLLYPIPRDLLEQSRERHKVIERLLTRAIGNPTYSDSSFILYNGDCCELLPFLEKYTFSVNLTITSPPYNIGKEYESPLRLDDYINWCSKWMSKIYSITEPNGTFWLNVGYLEVLNKGLCVPIPYLLWDKSPFYLIQEVVWKYGAGVTAKRRLSPRNEKWLYYIKDGNSYTFNLHEIRDPNVKYPNQRKNGKFRCNPLGKNPSDVWEFAKVTTGAKRSSKERTGHPAQFPLRVVERIVRVSSNPLEIVLDPFAGSCSAGVAAAGLGRVFLGIEISQEYCQLAIERYEEFKKEKDYNQRQLRLFTNQEE